MALTASFLALSGEIRNQIYEIILEDISSTPAPVYTLSHHPRSQFKKFDAGHQCSRPYLGLTQVCRLLRSEFKPLYTWHKPSIPFLDAPAYLKQYPLPDKEKSQQLAKILQDLGKPVKMANPALVDILPLLKYGLYNLPFNLYTDISKTRSHNRKWIVNFAVYWSYIDEPKYRDRLWYEKVVEIGMRQRGRPPKVAPTVEVIIVLDEEALDQLDYEEMLMFVQRLEPNQPTYGSVGIRYLVGSNTFQQYCKKRRQ